MPSLHPLPGDMGAEIPLSAQQHSDLHLAESEAITGLRPISTPKQGKFWRQR